MNHTNDYGCRSNRHCSGCAMTQPKQAHKVRMLPPYSTSSNFRLRVYLGLGYGYVANRVRLG